MVAKLPPYGFNKTSTEYLKAYLSYRKLKIKRNKMFSNWTNILHGVPQGSMLSPQVFNVFLRDLLLLKSNIDLVSYADWSVSFLIKRLSAGLSLQFFKNKTVAQVFFCEFWEISKNIFFTEHLRLLLYWNLTYYMLFERLKNAFKNSAVCVLFQ